MRPILTLSPKSGVPAEWYDPYRDKSTIEFGFRSRRFQTIQRLIEQVLAKKGKCDVLDLGGTESYWLIGEEFIQENRGRLAFTLVNSAFQEIQQKDLFSFVQSSATFPDLLGSRRFDLVHSNSVIEHVGSWHEMEMFAANARHLGEAYYIQTPNYWFPIEPHFRFPGFQYLPEAVRAQLMMRFRLGFFPRMSNLDEAKHQIHHHKLLSTRQMRRLFPDGTITHEKFFKLNKSILAVREPTSAR